MKFFNYFLWNQLPITLRRGHSFPRGHSRDSVGICLHFELIPPGSWIRSLPNHSFRLPAVILRFLLLVGTTMSSLEIARNLVCTLNWPVLLCWYFLRFVRNGTCDRLSSNWKTPDPVCPCWHVVDGQTTCAWQKPGRFRGKLRKMLLINLHLSGLSSESTPVNGSGWWPK